MMMRIQRGSLLLSIHAYTCQISPILFPSKLIFLHFPIHTHSLSIFSQPIANCWEQKSVGNSVEKFLIFVESFYYLVFFPLFIFSIFGLQRRRKTVNWNAQWKFLAQHFSIRLVLLNILRQKRFLAYNFGSLDSITFSCLHVGIWISYIYSAYSTPTTTTLEG